MSNDFASFASHRSVHEETTKKSEGMLPYMGCESLLQGERLTAQLVLEILELKLPCCHLREERSIRLNE